VKLSLSGRVIEVDYKYCEIPVTEFLEFAKHTGYEAVELRATQITADTPSAQVESFGRKARELALGISAFTAAGVKEDDSGFKLLDRYAAIARDLGCEYLKIGGSLAWLSSAAERVAPCGLKLASQIHTGGPFEQTEQAVKSLAAIAKENFGLFYDAANLLEAGETDWAPGIRRLGKHIFQVSVQNVCPAESNASGHTWELGGKRYRRCRFGETGGVDYPAVFKALGEIGFEGYVTVNEARLEGRPYGELARYNFECLRKLMIG
jgi:sugar phosphate isomerase/epimerase